MGSVLWILIMKLNQKNNNSNNNQNQECDFIFVLSFYVILTCFILLDFLSNTSKYNFVAKLIILIWLKITKLPSWWKVSQFSI